MANRVVKRASLILIGLLCVGSGYLLGRTPPPPAESNLVQEVRLESSKVTDTGALYDDFDVVVHLHNRDKQDTRDLKVVVGQVHTTPGYPQVLPDEKRQVQYVPALPAGKEVSLRFRGFKVFHPEERQEVVVNIVGHPGLRKVTYRAVFPPGSQD